MAAAIESIRIEGFKSIRQAQVDLRNLNVLIGANGSGKSNFIGAFRFLHELIAGNLRVYVGRSGGANSLLYFGSQTTPVLLFYVTFAAFKGNTNGYFCSLVPTTEDNFVFQNEWTDFHDRWRYSRPFRETLGAGHSESALGQRALNRPMVRYVLDGMLSWRVYHFHDTSDTARVKQVGDINDNRFLRNDASNLAAYLYYLQIQRPDHYQKIVGSIRQIAPFFKDFALRPDRLNPDKIRLEWIEDGSDAYFNASALSDGTLRFMSLATLLLQPTDQLPSTILLDEPELGLHPAAIQLLAGMLKAAAKQTQVIVSTQSVTLVNQFDAEDILAVERENHETVFRRFGPDDIAHWMDDYALGDLWEKNVIGARPRA